MTDDFVVAHGHLTLGTRLKRLGERMQTEVAEVSTALGMPTAAGLLTALGAIEARGALAVGELAAALGVSQPAATKLAARLSRAGLVTTKTNAGDKRARIIEATPEGCALVRTGRTQLWPAVEAAVCDLCKDASGSFLESIETIEAGLADKSLSQRILEKLEHGDRNDDAT